MVWMEVLLGLDIRLPIALLFLLLGAFLMGYGFLGPAPSNIVRPPFNVNLAWGVVMTLFGAILLAAAWAGRRRT
jgi:hypothetical protein